MIDPLLFSLLPENYAYKNSVVESLKKLPYPTRYDLNQIFESNDKNEIIEAALQQLDNLKKQLHKHKIKHTHYWDANYPKNLKTIDKPPWVLFYKGSLPNQDLPKIAIIGSRRPNDYGAQVLATIIPKIQSHSPKPIQIISGLAHGIDSLAHLHACKSRIQNFAILGNGVDLPYPLENLDLAKNILDVGGGVISEFAPGTQALPRNFPRRNRIISGLSDLLWVVQGTSKSGSLHTAKHALDQGKTIVTTPGSIFSELSELPHRLLQEGAQPIIHSQDFEIFLNTNQMQISF